MLCWIIKIIFWFCFYLMMQTELVENEKLKFLLMLSQNIIDYTHSILTILIRFIKHWILNKYFIHGQILPNSNLPFAFRVGDEGFVKPIGNLIFMEFSYYWITPSSTYKLLIINNFSNDTPERLPDSYPKFKNRPLLSKN